MVISITSVTKCRTLELIVWRHSLYSFPKEPASRTSLPTVNTGICGRELPGGPIPKWNNLCWRALTAKATFTRGDRALKYEKAASGQAPIAQGKPVLARRRTSYAGRVLGYYKARTRVVLYPTGGTHYGFSKFPLFWGGIRFAELISPHSPEGSGKQARWYLSFDFCFSFF